MQIFLDFSAIKIKNIAFISAILSGVQDLSWTSIFSKIGFLAVGKYTLIESTEKYLMVTVLTKSLEPIPQQWTHKENFNLRLRKKSGVQDLSWTSKINFGLLSWTSILTN